MQMGSEFKFIAEYIRKEIEEMLMRVGLLCRVFGRGKENLSLVAKINNEVGKYAIGGKLVQDAIGIRVALYFEEDIELVAQLIASKFTIDNASSTIDTPNTDQFTVNRHNLVFKVPDAYSNEMGVAIRNRPIDTTFELQLRSILSEGWHEVDHDLRYKSKSNWINQGDLSRALNGIMATLETSEWSMRKIFDDLAYRHYKQQNWPAMLHSKVRMRVKPDLSENLIELMNQDNDFAKNIFRIDRNKVIHVFGSIKPHLPISLDNIVGSSSIAL